VFGCGVVAICSCGWLPKCFVGSEKEKEVEEEEEVEKEKRTRAGGGKKKG
jgi:hypothetical protein